MTPAKKKPIAAPVPTKIVEEDLVDLALRIFSQQLAASGASLDLEPLRRSLREHLGGMSHYVRSGRPATSEELARAAVDMLVRDGKSVTQVSRELGISRSSVWRLRAAAKAS